MKTSIKSMLFASIICINVISCKKSDDTPAPNNSSSNTSFTWNGVTYNTASGGNSVNQTISEKLCGYYVIYSFSSSTSGNSTVGNYIYLYLPSDVSSGTYAIENYGGTSSGSNLQTGKAYLFVYNLSTSGTNTDYKYGYATNGNITIQRTGNAITATFDNVDTYSEAYSNASTAVSTGKLSGKVVSSSLTYDLSSINCGNTSGSNNGNGNNSTTTGTGTTNTTSGGNTSSSPLVGSFAFSGISYVLLSDSVSIISANGTGIAAFNSATISGGNNYRALATATLKNPTGTFATGDYKIDNSDSTTNVNTSTLLVEIVQNAANITVGYAVSGKITVSIANGASTFTLVDVVLNSSLDGTGTNLGKITGTFTK